MSRYIAFIGAWLLAGCIVYSAYLVHPVVAVAVAAVLMLAIGHESKEGGK
jgi:hypothetical protein